MRLQKSFQLALNILFHSKLRSWLTIIGTIIGIGAVVAQTQEEPPASAVEALTPTPTVQDQNQVVVTQPSTPVSKAPIVKTPVAKAPTIAKPPTGRGGEEAAEVASNGRVEVKDLLDSVIARAGQPE